MPIELILQYYVTHVNSIIVWLIVVTLGLIALYLLLSLRDDKIQLENGQSHFVNLEETLKKVLEQATGIGNKEASPRRLEATSETAVTPAAGGDAVRLASEVESQAKRIKELEAALAAKGSEPGASDAAPSGGTSLTVELETKVQGLEAKLAEYQVVEDDIANLSLYRDENAKLKDELERLKSGREISPDPTPAKAKDTDEVAEFEAALEAQAKSVPESIPPLAQGDEASPLEDDLMSEFESVVKAQKQTELVASSNAEIARAVEAPMNQDLMGDFEATVRPGLTPATTAEAPLAATPEAAVPAPRSAEGEGETAGVTATPEGLTAPANAPAAEPKTPTSLAVQLDTDQMVSEVNGFKPVTEEPAAELSEGDRLIAEFENFVKSEGGVT